MGSYHPAWAGSVEQAVIRYVSKNVWRTLPEHDADDLYQEGFLAFLICAGRYRVRKANHFKGLLLRCLMNRVHDLASKRTRRREVHALFDLSSDRGGIDELELRLLIEDAPAPVAQLLSRLPELGSEDRRFKRFEDGQRETTEAYLTRLTGATCRRNLFAAWLTGERVVLSSCQ